MVSLPNLHSSVLSKEQPERYQILLRESQASDGIRQELVKEAKYTMLMQDIESNKQKE